jgi:hypothetical protein
MYIPKIEVNEYWSLFKDQCRLVISVLASQDDYMTLAEIVKMYHVPVRMKCRTYPKCSIIKR